jgi:hydroxyethylthiazole kinase-like uncharacterized protein yjeF
MLMACELLTPMEMAEADRLAIEGGPFDGYALMRNAGIAVAAEALRRFPAACRFDVLCGPGNNGGDGYVAAQRLLESGAAVMLWCLGDPRPGTDAALAAADCMVPRQELEAYRPQHGTVVIDALFGAGLARALSGPAAAAALALEKTPLPVLAVDLPSGLSGETGRPLGPVLHAAATVTFFRKKPGHLLYPGRSLCGDVKLVDIGIPDRVLARVAPRLFENDPVWWVHKIPVPAEETHKYARGHVGVFSGGPLATGAARLAARAAARMGAGAVTVLAPEAAAAINAAQLTAIMVRTINDAEALMAVAESRPATAYVFGPGLEVGAETRALGLALLAARPSRGVVLDASALRAFAEDQNALLAAIAANGERPVVLTPHESEFAALFPELKPAAIPSKLERARAAARRAGAVVLLKGPDSVIAAPDGWAAINANGTPWLATAGSGDVLAGMIAALIVQGMPAFEATAASVWIHAEAGRTFGPGLIADDLPEALPPVISRLLEWSAEGRC